MFYYPFGVHPEDYAVLQYAPPSEGRRKCARYIGKPKPMPTEPKREDFPSRQAYRAAMRQWQAQSPSEGV